LGALLLLIVWISEWRRKQVLRKEDEERRRFILQTLTHELRTPAATLKLGVEEFRRDYDSLPERLQSGFLRMCDEVQRLNRIISASTQYLTSQAGERAWRPNPQPVESVNDFFRSLVENYDGRVEFLPLPSDRSFALDSYWLGMCVKNLIENALQHGKAPVQLSLVLSESGLEISVKDAGFFPVEKFKRMLLPFQRSEGSVGLGLGLTIVRKVTTLIGGEFSFSPAPTTMTILLKGSAT
jgi:signal transduction histidine kinase